MEKNLNNSIASILLKVLFAALLMALAIFISDLSDRQVSRAEQPPSARDTG